MAVASAASQPLALRVSRGGDGAVVITVAGELDVSGAPVLRQAMIDALAELSPDGPPRLVVDVSALDFIDSTGLGVLVGGFKRARTHGVDFVLSRPSSAVSRVFEIAGLDKILPVRVSA